MMLLMKPEDGKTRTRTKEEEEGPDFLFLEASKCLDKGIKCQCKRGVPGTEEGDLCLCVDELRPPKAERETRKKQSSFVDSSTCA